MGGKGSEPGCPICNGLSHPFELFLLPSKNQRTDSAGFTRNAGDEKNELPWMNTYWVCPDHEGSTRATNCVVSFVLVRFPHDQCEQGFNRMGRVQFGKRHVLVYFSDFQYSTCPSGLFVRGLWKSKNTSFTKLNERLCHYQLMVCMKIIIQWQKS